MNLLAELSKFDGKHREPLEKLASQVAHDVQVVDLLVAAAESDVGKLQAGATWVIKRLCDSGKHFSATETRSVLKLIPKVGNVEAKLHLLQLLPNLKVSKRQAWTLFGVIEEFLNAEENKFLRAWSYNALIDLADKEPQLRDRASAYAGVAREEESASVKARIRNAAKAVDWL